MRISVGSLWILIAALGWGSAPIAAAPPTLNSVYPAGAARREAVTVTLSGKFDHWPPNIWMDRDGLAVAAEKERGQLKVTVPPEAQPGVYWLRLFDREGATAMQAFVVGTIAEVAEQEPNDRPTVAQKLAASATVNGRLAKRGDVDCYAINLKNGQTLVASMLAHRTLDSPIDPVLQIATPDGFVLEQNDDSMGIDPQIVFVAPEEGTYLVRTFAFPSSANSTIGFAGETDAVYRLTITTGGFLDHAFPLVLARSEVTELQLAGWNLPDSARHLTVPPQADGETAAVFHPELAGALHLPLGDGAGAVAEEWSDPARPQPIDIPTTVTGKIEAAGDVDAFHFQGRKGRKLSLRAKSRSLGYELDVRLRLTDAEGKVLATADSGDALDRDVEIDYEPPADGEYRLLVQDLFGYGGFRHVYRLSVEDAVPDYALQIESGSYVLTPGKPLEISVTVERKHGFAEKIKISAAALPSGVKVDPITSRPDQEVDPEKRKPEIAKLTLTADQGPSNGPIHVVGEATKGPRMARTARFRVAPYGMTQSSVWLTVLESPREGDSPREGEAPAEP